MPFKHQRRRCQCNVISGRVVARRHPPRAARPEQCFGRGAPPHGAIGGEHQRPRGKRATTKLGRPTSTSGAGEPGLGQRRRTWLHTRRCCTGTRCPARPRPSPDGRSGVRPLTTRGPAPDVFDISGARCSSTLPTTANASCTGSPWRGLSPTLPPHPPPGRGGRDIRADWMQRGHRWVVHARRTPGATQCTSASRAFSILGTQIRPAQGAVRRLVRIHPAGAAWP